MTFLYALATLWPKIEHAFFKKSFTVKILKPAVKGHRLVYVWQALLTMTFCFILFSNPVNAQELRKEIGANAPLEIHPLIVGQRVPDDFWTREHLFYINGDTVRRTLGEYKGKLLVLDFWATWCAICLAQMKEKQQLFSNYPDETAFLLVNSLRTKDNYEAIQKRHDKISASSLGGKIESIIEDSYLQGLFPTKSYPRYVWIGPYGNVVAMTMALSVTDGHLKDMLNLFNEHNGKK